MKIKFIDWEIEKDNYEDFGGYNHRYCLEEIINEDDSKAQTRVIVSTNDIKKITRTLGKIALDGIKIEFIKNDSLIQYRKNFKECN